MKEFEQAGNIWVPKTYKAQGNWSIKAQGDALVFKLERDFRTQWGPDLKLYCSTLDLDRVRGRDQIADQSDLVDDLQGPDGTQQYTLPTDNFGAYKSMIIHCKRFSVVWCGVKINQ